MARRYKKYKFSCSITKGEGKIIETKINTSKLLNVSDLTEDVTVKVNEYQGLYSEVKTSFEMETGYNYVISGNDLVITNSENAYTITVTDYFKANGSSKMNLLVGTNYDDVWGIHGDMIADGVVDNKNLYNAANRRRRTSI